ncbi:YsnF/AvaK domain-containing protein [Saccharibacillus qingshengii]|uniref:YsnF/AvaK domain-containing protein n=1 Tax=Saccharibacillus qingshengii TaxID=1763540 RepID=UPI001556237C|nr:YsnF/AvaK domain-containing protein [Saccharibacillus qingshengii]
MATQKVAGIFLTQREASEAIEDLKRSGYDTDDISVISKDHQDAAAIGEQTGTKAPEGAAGGATAGGILGGVGGLLAGLGALAIPGIGPLLAAGPIATALAGIAVGATGGGLVGGLIGLGIPEEDAKSYHEHIGGGRMLVLVDTDSEHKAEVEQIFRNHYALNHTQLGAASDTDNLTVAAPHETEPRSETPVPQDPAAVYRTNDKAEEDLSRASRSRAPAGESTLQLRAQQLEIDKKQVRTGEVEVRKEIVHEEKLIRVPVTHEEVVIERRAVEDGTAEGPIGRDETIRIPVSEERIEVNKHNVITEEVDVYKQNTQENLHIEETVKHEEARVEHTGQTSVKASPAEEAEDLRSSNPLSSLPQDPPPLPPRSERNRP